MIPLPAELLERHAQPAPRYTSYPTAMHWSHAPSAEQWMHALDAALAPAGARAGLYVHVPFCQALCTFCGCNLRVARSHSLAAPYVDKLLREHALYRERLAKPALPLGALYLGGGTPTWLPPEQLDRLLERLLLDATAVPDADFALEADPRNATREQLALLARHGFRRIVIGVQDFDARVLEIVNRVQTEAEVRRTLDDARELGFASVAFDFIYGLPLQTLDSLRSSLAILVRMRPDRVNFLPYAHVPWIKPSQRLYTEADLPDLTLRHEMFRLGRALLGEAGYMEIGIDQYALPDDALARALAAGSLSRSFMGFAARRIDALIGLGVSAIGDTPAMYAQNEKNLQRYETRVMAGELPLQRGHVLDARERRIREVMAGLFGAGEAMLLSDDRSAPWWSDAQQALQPLLEDGLVRLSGTSIRVTEAGRTFLPQIAAAIDPRMAAPGEAPRLDAAAGA